MRLILTRLGGTSRGTIGILEGGGLELWTIEQPWRENRPFQSCIPIGEYTLAPYDSDKFPGCYAVTGGCVSLEPDHRKERNKILFHVANTMKDVVGCIGVGTHGGWLDHLPGVRSSKVALSEMRATLGRINSHQLIIRQAGLAL